MLAHQGVVAGLEGIHAVIPQAGGSAPDHHVAVLERHTHRRNRRLRTIGEEPHPRKTRRSARRAELARITASPEA